MSDEDEPMDMERALTVLIVVLLVMAVVLVIFGELLVAGVTFLSLTFAIYLRETW